LIRGADQQGVDLAKQTFTQRVADDHDDSNCLHELLKLLEFAHGMVLLRV